MAVEQVRQGGRKRPFERAGGLDRAFLRALDGMPGGAQGPAAQEHGALNYLELWELAYRRSV